MNKSAIKLILLSAPMILGVIVLALYHFTLWKFTPSPGDTRVLIYTTAWCPYCQSLRNTLDEYDIHYSDYDVERTWHGRIGYWVLGAKGVPTSVIGEQIIIGYDGQIITDALVDAGYELAPIWPQE